MESTLLITRGWGGENGELLLNGWRVSVGSNEKEKNIVVMVAQYNAIDSQT